jgi:hypothetical protein
LLAGTDAASAAWPLDAAVVPKAIGTTVANELSFKNSTIEDATALKVGSEKTGELDVATIE